MELQGKVALVTGGTKGIGAATAVELARHGADIAINGRYDDDDAAQTKAVVEALGRRCEVVLADVGRAAEATRCVTETVERLGTIDVLVHSAGGGIPGGFLEVSPEAWQNAFDVHVHAIFHMARAAVPIMQQKQEAAIVLISSVAGIRGIPMMAAYQVVKGAIVQFTRALAMELAGEEKKGERLARKQRRLAPGRGRLGGEMSKKDKEWLDAYQAIKGAKGRMTKLEAGEEHVKAKADKTQEDIKTSLEKIEGKMDDVLTYSGG